MYSSDKAKMGFSHYGSTVRKQQASMAQRIFHVAFFVAGLLFGLFCSMTMKTFGDAATTLSLASSSSSGGGGGESNSRIAMALEATPLGSLGPKGTMREHYTYYDSLFYLSMQYGRQAKSLLEVGCASDPFAKYLSWIDQRTCVAPYQVTYDGKNHGPSASVDFVKADFMEYKSDKEEKFDLLICSQVVEHVPDPAGFMKKLVEAAKTSIISVPYMWPACDNCNHKTNNITLDTILKWVEPHKPQHHTIITEADNNKYNRRIAVVFHNP